VIVAGRDAGPGPRMIDGGRDQGGAVDPAGAGPDVADEVAAAVRAHPAVVRLDGGRYGEIVSLLPGRSVLGVRTGIGPGGGVEVGVVLRFGPPIPDVVAQLRSLVREVTGPVPVDIAVADLVDG
jgi:hypothetical protein